MLALAALGRRSAKSRFLSRALLCAVIAVLAVPANAQAPIRGPMKTLLGLGQGTTPTTPPATTGTGSPPHESAATAIPLPDVASRAEDLKRTLRYISDQLPTPDQLEQVKATLDSRDEPLQERLKESDALLSGTPSTLELREEENYWRAEQKETSDLRAQLLIWANAAQGGIQRLQAQTPVWTETLDLNRSSPGLGPTLDVIEKAVTDLQQLTASAQNRLRTIVNLQVRAATQDQMAADVLGRLDRKRESLNGKLFERDSLPLWELGQRREAGENKEVFAASANRLTVIRVFASQVRGALVGLFLLLVISLFGAYRLHRVTEAMKPETDQQAEVRHIAHHWIALGLLPPLLLAYLLAPLAPLPLIGLAILVSFVPMLVLLPRLIQPRFRLLLYCVAGVYALNALIAWAGLSPTHKREIQFLVNVVVVLVFAFLTRSPRMFEGTVGSMHQARVFAIRLALVVLAVSLIANLFGYVKLSQFLGIVCVYSAFIAISMFTGVRVFTRLLLEGVDSAAAQQLAVVRLYRDSVIRWVPRVFHWTGLLIWLLVTVNLLGLSDWFAGIFSSVLSFHIAGVGAGVTFGGVIGFFLILLVGYAVSSAIRFLLREELLRRFHLARGVPELIASILHYLLLLLIFLLAINAGGVELNKFTVLTGALGVGVGFGLQNIVNNFISGLILQFERPIHVGDILDVDGTTGKVSRIGIRSSTVKTFQGAEVIIPNGNFISGKVINWTLSESMRRVELPVGIAYGSEPKVVTDLLNQAAIANEAVLTSPPPAVYFKEFGDSALNFELQFWVMQESNTVKVKSEVALAAMALLGEAGIEIPFPQRDLRLRTVDPIAAAALLAQPSQSSLSLNDEGDLSGVEPIKHPSGSS